ncbi:thiamine pyrophosphate-dependent enzyme [Halobaculum lipolyticum]|uniref:Thiamine pyrophosphate-dependent enzyme n=1 Tax=Halobaculum lipolyticum TaxID=3032001 RepID=A0ABD5WGK3_9EURY|nr:thiamine pyrophosphate-dependent enzyme [Halobaculum sp. DT31]
MTRIVGERDLADTRFDADDARAALRDVVRTRRFDERAIALQRRGWMSGYPPYEGQEAAQVGAAHAMREDDHLFPTYRSNALQIARGVPMSDILLFRRGFAEYRSDHDVPVFPQAVPIASQIPHAAGAGMAANYTDADWASLVCFGDGATSEGDFHEGLNFAGVFDAPTVFFCENNGWAISLPRERQTASESIAVKADAYGIDGVQVDGNDPLAVRAVVEDALASARDGDPVLVEALTYRRGAHTTADDPDQYRDGDPDLPEWRLRDPFDRFAEWCETQGVVDGDFIDDAIETANEELAEAVETAESVPRPEPEEQFDSLYAELPADVRRQREAARAAADDHPETYELER